MRADQRRRAARRGFIAVVPALYTLFTNKWYVDDFYRAGIVRLTLAAARLLHWLEDRALDANFDRLGGRILASGLRATRVQNGWMQIYAGCAVLLLGACSIYLVLR